MRFGVLGRMEVRRGDGTLVPIFGPARRQLLAALLCRGGSLVTAATLIDDLWGGAAPRTAVTTLRSHVARLRDDLGRDEARSLVRTEGDGYRLAIAADELDAASFERLVTEGGDLTDPHIAMRRYDQALALWRDEAYVEFGDAPFAVGERIRLAELRALTSERRTDLALGLGMSAELVGNLEQRVRLEPYRERSWEQLALAYYRAGRQGDALATCRRARQLLAEDLGVDLGPALHALEDRLLRQDPELLVTAISARPVGRTVHRCPYLGLAGYEERDAPLFIGRERLTATLAGRLSDQSIVVLTGASGVGKSSLVRAGLIPVLRSGALPGSTAWRIDTRTPTEGLAFADSVRPPDLLVLDQAEELFTNLDLDARDALIEGFTEYVEKHDGRLLLVLRSDFYGRLVDVEALAPFAEKTAVVVGPMRADELRRAVVEPALAAGLRLEPDLVETIMEDAAGQPEPLPLLSEAMVRTWQRRDGGLLTLEGYRLAGGVASALEAAAEECYGRLGDIGRRATRHLLVRMAAHTATGWVRRPILRAGFAASGAERDTLAALVDARLVLVSDERVEVTHDAVLGHWPRLRDWLAERALAAEVLRHLDQAATNWLVSGRQDGDLYRGPRLSTAMDWRAAHPDDVSPSEGEFLEASARAADFELAGARAQVVREVRVRRRLRSVAAVLAAVLVLAAATAIIAWRERSTARSETNRAEHAALAADARRLAALSANAPDIATSSLLAVAAYRLQDSPDTRGALLGAVERNESALWRVQTQHRPQRVIASPDGSRLATIDNRRDVEVFDVATRKQIAAFQAYGDEIEGMTANDRDIVVYGPANDEGNDIGRLSIIDIATGKRIRIVTTAGDRSGIEPVMTSDGRWLAMLTTQHRGGRAIVDVFDATNWTVPPRQFVEPDEPAVLGAGRSAFALELSDGSVDVRALPSLRPIGALTAAPGTRQQHGGLGLLAVSPDGSHIARIDPGDQRSVVVYGIGSRQTAKTPLARQDQSVSQMAFSPNGAEIAVGTLDGSVTVYRTLDGNQSDALAGHAGAVLGIAWTGSTAPTGLYSVGLDSQLISWSQSAAPRTMTESGPDIAAPDRGETFGHLVFGLTPSQGSAPESHERAYLIDLDSGRRSFWSLGLDDRDYINQAVASSNGKRALISIETEAGLNRIEIWDLTRAVQVGQLALPSGTAQFPVGLNAAISPDGRTAYSSLGATRIGMFDLPSGRYVRSFTVRFADPDSARIYAIPWMFDPNGRLLTGGYDPNPTAGATPPSPGPLDRRSPDQRLGLLDVKTLKLIAQTSLGDVSFPTSVAWSPDRTRLAVGTYEGTLALYNAATLSMQANAGVVEPGWIKTASFAPDGRTLVTGGTFGAINFYSVPDLRRMGGPLDIGNSSNNGGVFAWYGDGGQVEGYGSDLAKQTSGSLQRWFVFHVDPASLVSTACGQAGSDITRSQWQRYVGDRPYRHVCP